MFWRIFVPPPRYTVTLHKPISLPAKGKRAMLDRKLYELCSRITTERDPKKLAAVINDLIKLLAEEQDAIKRKISSNLSQSMTAPE